MRSSQTNRSIPRRIFRVVGILCLCVMLVFGGLIAFLSATEYQPQAQEPVELQGSGLKKLRVGESATIVAWNIGYGALGDHADFFMDGGQMVQTADESRIQQNLADIAAAIDSMHPDIVMLQETDRSALRSRHVNEFGCFTKALPGTVRTFANNFKAAFVPYPVPPIGKVHSGIATFSSYETSSAERIQLPVPFSWPVRMANLKRCLLVTRLPIANSEHELVLFNLHPEAYDDGEGKTAQTKMLADLLCEEADRGNYVIAGGDFNQLFKGIDASAYPVQKGNRAANKIDTDMFRWDWQFLMDTDVPTCRSLYKMYAGADPDSFQFYIIDSFIVSGNISVQSFATQDLGFKASDHNPILLQFMLT